MSAPTERMATTLLRVTLHDGVLNKAPRLDVCLRAALFADLILAGRVDTYRGAPVVIDPDDIDEIPDDSDPIPDDADLMLDDSDRMLDAVEAAIAARRRVQWWRWYRHVEGDRPAMTRELVAVERWAIDDATALPRDLQVENTTATAEDLALVRRRRQEPRDPAQATLAYLCELATTARSADLLEAWSPVLIQALGDDPARPALTDALSAASTVRRGRFTRSLRR